MSKVDDTIKKESEKSAAFKKAMERENRISTIAKSMREYRAKSGLTQTAFAKKAGVDRTTIARIESADMNPTLELIVRITENIGEPLSFRTLASKTRVEM